MPFIIFALINKLKKPKQSKKAITEKYVKQKYETQKVTSTKKSKANPRINLSTKKWREACNEFVVIDLETTGLDAKLDDIIEIAAVRYKDKKIIDSYTTLVNPLKPIPEHITKINGITNEMVKNAPTIEEALPKLIDFISDSIIVAHNASFDLKFLKSHAARMGIEISNPYTDTLTLSRKVFPELENHKLTTVANHIGFYADTFHRAYNDAMACGQILLKCIEILDKNDLAKKNIQRKKTNFG